MLYQVSQGYPETQLHDAALGDIAGELIHARPSGLLGPNCGIGISTVSQNIGHGSDRHDVIDHGRFAKKSRKCRDRWFGAHHSALAF